MTNYEGSLIDLKNYIFDVPEWNSYNGFGRSEAIAAVRALEINFGAPKSEPNLRASNIHPSSEIRDCIFNGRGDDSLLVGPDGVLRMIGYAVIPIEQYMGATALDPSGVIDRGLPESNTAEPVAPATDKYVEANLKSVARMEKQASEISDIVQHPAFKALKHQWQADADGVMVEVSRQALDEVMAMIEQSPAHQPVAPSETSLFDEDVILRAIRDAIAESESPYPIDLANRVLPAIRPYLRTPKPVLGDPHIDFFKEAQITLCAVRQLLSGWHADGTAWSQWDREVEEAVEALQYYIEERLK